MTKIPALYYKQNRMKQLRAFCHASRTGSISEAAEQLFLSQPTVTLQIQALERELNTTLFERRGPKIQLTPEGKLLYELSNSLVDGIDQLHETFAANSGRLESGNLNIAAGESTILYILPDFVNQFNQTYPQIHLKLLNVTGRDGMALIRSDKADFAVGSMLEVPDDVIYRPIFTYNPVLITPKDHPLAEKEHITLDDISPYGLILPPHHLSTWRVVDMAFRQQNLSFHVSLEAGGWEIIKKYVELGMGVSIVTDVCLTGDENLIRKPLDEYFPKRSYGLVLRKGKFLSPQARRFIEVMDPEFFTAHKDR
ncbi:MAG: LysR family transcriptional regulator [gamma proteobacterium symbiont of Bathyaustriella thionipta]|nr:LysR family transcriptional regulator [gamma proteobacterium symbiont of Bathyaustriella thionipta]MCU7951137.1 LysR family transcriptional regulator [gamma proteobacterium symbiont of Bathyaustriella thionipta]MCU7954886.1 LysR family transcriptional regulator [gamma proteobacterium symbiont of Bathyaustriella thionipta]MCU7957652.1 LysR family transcriptional regulator [gamma proteobacterium symbiont of Bathyaustriella thionipta]